MTAADVAPVRDLHSVPAFLEERYTDCYSGWDQKELVEEAASLAAAIEWAFNPRDDDAAQVSILVDCVLAAGQFIAEQPCRCVGDGEEYGPCRRCEVLGRLADQVAER